MLVINLVFKLKYPFFSFIFNSPRVCIFKGFKKGVADILCKVMNIELLCVSSSFKSTMQM